MVLRVSVPFPVVLFDKEERPNTELAEKSLNSISYLPNSCSYQSKLLLAYITYNHISIIPHEFFHKEHNCMIRVEPCAIKNCYKN